MGEKFNLSIKELCEYRNAVIQCLYRYKKHKSIDCICMFLINLYEYCEMFTVNNRNICSNFKEVKRLCKDDNYEENIAKQIFAMRCKLVHRRYLVTNEEVKKFSTHYLSYFCKLMLSLDFSESDVDVVNTTLDIAKDICPECGEQLLSLSERKSCIYCGYEESTTLN